MEQTQISQLAQNLHEARKKALELEPLTKTFEDFSLETAYKIQAQGIRLREEDNESIIGYKMGLTSKAKMEQMGLHQPIFGVLTNSMQIENKGKFGLKDKIHPKAEPEMYFITNKDLSGSLTPEEALKSCSHIGVAIEVLDSRYRGFKYFTLPDVVADNSSSAYFVLGDSIKPNGEMNFSDLKITISDSVNTLFEAKTNAILGNPLLSLCELITLLSHQGKALPAGSLVLAGAATQAIPLSADTHIEAQIENIGSASFKVTP